MAQHVGREWVQSFQLLLLGFIVYVPQCLTAHGCLRRKIFSEEIYMLRNSAGGKLAISIASM